LLLESESNICISLQSRQLDMNIQVTEGVKKWKTKRFTLCSDLCWSLFKFGSDLMYDSAGSWLNSPPLSNLGAYSTDKQNKKLQTRKKGVEKMSLNEYEYEHTSRSTINLRSWEFCGFWANSWTRLSLATFQSELKLERLDFCESPIIKGWKKSNKNKGQPHYCKWRTKFILVYPPNFTCQILLLWQGIAIWNSQTAWQRDLNRFNWKCLYST